MGLKVRNLEVFYDGRRTFLMMNGVKDFFLSVCLSFFFFKKLQSVHRTVENLNFHRHQE